MRMTLEFSTLIVEIRRPYAMVWGKMIFNLGLYIQSNYQSIMKIEMTFRYAKSQKFAPCMPFSEATRGCVPPKWVNKLRKWKSQNSRNSGSSTEEREWEFPRWWKGDPSMIAVQPT